ncbi:MAG: hypothetical protein ACRCTQ_03635 [Brevinemataceae bacterium]
MNLYSQGSLNILKINGNKGDLWLLGEHKLYIGDSLFEDSYQKLLGKEVVDMVFTDPPYNVEYTMYEVS